eukprot:12238960-Ditylum_brightwellii.AAC.1
MALEMYREEEMWEDALKVAEVYAPHLYKDVELAYGCADSKHRGSKSDQLNKGQSMEKSGQLEKAIDSYLSASSETISNHDDLEDVWMNAIR